MATQPEVVKQSDLLNQLVLDRNTMEELGHVDVVWMHPPVHRVLGFICKSGFLGTKRQHLIWLKLQRWERTAFWLMLSQLRQILKKFESLNLCSIVKFGVMLAIKLAELLTVCSTSKPD